MAALNWITKSLQRLKKPRLAARMEFLNSYVNYTPDRRRPSPRETDLARLKISFVIPDFQPGAGGHMTIFRIGRYLETFGHEVSFLIQNPTVHKTATAAFETINTHFQPFSGSVQLFRDTLPEAHGDALVATDRFTCYPARAMGGFVRRFYLVQDYETQFYAAGAEALLTEATYRFDFDCLCAGDWLHQLMSEKYGRWSVGWPLAFDPAIYNFQEKAGRRSSNRIALYARYVTPRRAVELAFMALESLHKRGVAFEVDLFGFDFDKLALPYPFRNHGVLTAPELAALYRQATLGIVFSSTNHSLVNKEMMACGLPVVDLDLENVRAIFPDDVMAFAPPTPDGIADTIQALLNKPAERDRLQQRGLEFVSDLSWEKSARIVEAALQNRVAHYAGMNAQT